MHFPNGGYRRELPFALDVGKKCEERKNDSLSSWKPGKRNDQSLKNSFRTQQIFLHIFYRFRNDTIFQHQARGAIFVGAL